MSAAPRIVQATPDLRPLVAALCALTVAATFIIALAFGQQAATQSATVPAAGAAPIAFDRGWASAPSVGSASVAFDRGWASAPSEVKGLNRGSQGNAGKGSSGGSNGTDNSNRTRLPR